MSKFYNHRYYEIVTSLPELVLPLPAYKVAPLSDYEMQTRVTMISDEDRDEVLKTVDLLCRDSLDSDNKAMLKEVEEALETFKNEGLKELIIDNMRMRTVESALLLSVAGDKLPDKKTGEDENWGYDEDLMGFIRANWGNSPYFSLLDEFPTLRELRKLMLDDQPLKMYDWIQNHRWSHYIDIEDGYEFSIENVALFMVRRKMLKDRLERSAEKTTEIIQNAVTAMIDKVELNL